MDKKKGGVESGLLNVSLVVFGAVVLLLLYALFVRSFSPHVDPRREDNPGEFVGDIMQIEIRNGCGVTGLAAEMTQFLRKRGFDVVEVGDYDTFEQEHSVVYDRVGDIEAARKLAVSVGLTEDRVIQEVRPELYLDASLVIGKDYSTLLPFKEL